MASINVNISGTGAELDFDEEKYAGYEDEQNGPFNHDKHNECGRFYYDAFIDGCLSVSGNTRDVCESATDA